MSGFCSLEGKTALVTGASLVPVYSFGENELYGLTVPVGQPGRDGRRRAAAR